MTSKLRLVYKMVKPFFLTFSHNILSILFSLSSCNNGVNSVLTCFSSSLSCTSKRKKQYDTITLLHAWELYLISSVTAWISWVVSCDYYTLRLCTWWYCRIRIDARENGLYMALSTWLKTSDCNFKTIRTKRLIYPYLIFGFSVIFQTHFVVVDFLGGLAFVDLQDSATSKSENTSLWLL